VTSSAKGRFSLTDAHRLSVFLVTSVVLVSLTVHKELKTGTGGICGEETAFRRFGAYCAVNGGTS
jgi:hypothetical protein